MISQETLGNLYKCSTSVGIHLFSFLKVDMGTPFQWILNRDQHIISKIKTENIYSVIRGKGIAGQGRPLTKPHRDRQLVKIKMAQGVRESSQAQVTPEN